MWQWKLNYEVSYRGKRLRTVWRSSQPHSQVQMCSQSPWMREPNMTSSSTASPRLLGASSQVIKLGTFSFSQGCHPPFWPRYGLWLT
ncbi:hypothetical protein OJAV_G00020330 [Oryzias javanicus]|uniref:Uncharacterized protein n=1 Tax=Oryzias javanicus TaxID=123683 RepID=A0A437DHB4_ORYJA|nr:hypothetical protein OJAV_G00020330 [Oryzias javanicus]